MIIFGIFMQIFTEMKKQIGPKLVPRPRFVWLLWKGTKTFRFANICIKYLERF